MRDKSKINKTIEYMNPHVVELQRTTKFTHLFNGGGKHYGKR